LHVVSKYYGRKKKEDLTETGDLRLQSKEEVDYEDYDFASYLYDFYININIYLKNILKMEIIIINHYLKK
jgi:hypothetical protein